MGDEPPSVIDFDADTIAQQFLRSPYAGPSYVDWSLDRRIDTFLRRQGLASFADDGDASSVILRRIMTRSVRRPGALSAR